MEIDRSKENSQISIRKAEPSELDTLIRLAARAYDNEPFANWVVRQDVKRTQRMEKFFEVYFKDYGARYDHVFTTDELNGAAIWYPPEPKDCWRISTLKHLSLLHKWISISGIRNIPSLLADAEKVDRLHLEERHYFLHVIAVDPKQQGKGIGGNLLTHGLQMCDERGIPAYLETASEENVRYYQKHDFRVSEEIILSRGLKVWCMTYRP
jgi:ribosomal protein S18 acetylase RimI-like enzyme